MDSFTMFVVFTWLVLNTIISGSGIAMLIIVRREYRGRTSQLDIKDQLHHVLQQLDRERIHRDRLLRESVEQLIARLEADPLTRERHHLDIVELKDRLRA